MTDRFHLGVFSLFIFALLLFGSSCVCACQKAIERSSNQLCINVIYLEAWRLIQEHKENDEFKILDFRSSMEYALEHLENAINLDFASDSLEYKLDRLNRNHTYLIYGDSGCMSAKIMDIMKEKGFRTVINLLGGMTEWKEMDAPTVKP